MSKPTKHYGKWRIRWIDEFGRRQSAVVDDHKAALLELRQRELEADERRRGLRDPAPTERTFVDIAEYWERERVPLKRSGNDDKSILKHLRPAFARMKLSDFAGWIMAVDHYRASKAHLNVKTVVNHLTLLGSLLRLAHELGWMPRLPKIRKPKVRLISQDYCFLRTVDEVRRFLVAAEQEGEQTLVLYASAVYTGAREGELAALQWADVDFENRLVVIQRSFDGPTKADDVRYVPILDPLLPILRAWRLRAPGRLVFTNRDGRMWNTAPLFLALALAAASRPSGSIVRFAAHGFALGAASLVLLAHVMWALDIGRIATSSSTSALLFVFLPAYAVFAGLIMAVPSGVIGWLTVRKGAMGLR